MQLMNRKLNVDKESYNNLRSQYDALMVEPDIRLFEEHHFGPDGRVNVTAEELKYPTTAFGELRRIAIEQHMRKKRAARLICLWWGSILVRKGFITDDERKRELFEVHPDMSSQDLGSRHRSINDTNGSVVSRGSNLLWIRRRLSRKSHSASARTEETSLQLHKEQMAAIEESEEGRSTSLSHVDNSILDVEAAATLWAVATGESFAPSDNNFGRGSNSARSVSSNSSTDNGEILQSPSKMKRMIHELDFITSSPGRDNSKRH